MNKKTLILLTASLVGTHTWADNVTIPNTFVDGTTASAPEVNANFDAVKTAVDDNFTQTQSNESRITAIETVNAKGDGSSLDAADGSPVDVLAVDNGGLVRVSTSLGIRMAPNFPLAVSGDAYTTRGIKLGGSGGSRSALLELRNTVPWSRVIYATNQNNTQLFALTNSGNVTVLGSVTAASHITVSDGRYKKNIVTLANPLEKLLNLRGVSFTWDTNKNARFEKLPGKQVGFVAQEVKNVLPETVFKNDDGYLGVSYNAIVPLLVEAVKEQQQIIEEIRTEMRALKQHISVIQAKNDDRHPVDEQRLSMINN